MNIVKPIDIDLESSTVSESAYDEYDSSHTYTAEDISANTVYVSCELGGVIEDCEDAWNEYTDGDVVSSLDAIDYKIGAGSAKFVIAAGCDAGDILATESIDSQDMTGDSILKLWIKSSVAMDLGDLQVLLDDTASCASPIKSLDVPALAADTWTKISLDLGDASGLSAVISIGVKMVVDKGAFDLRIDDVRSLTSDEADRTPHEIYKSLVDANLNNYPPNYAAKWSLIGSTNKWKMFDEFVNTQTEDTTNIIVEIDASKSNAVGLFELIGKTVTLTLSVNSVIKKTEIIDLDNSPIFDYWDYFFGEFSYKSAILWIYPYYYSNAVLKIEIEPYLDKAKCGMCVPGKFLALGKTRWGPQIGLSNWSKKDTDSLGRTYLKKGNNAKELSFDFRLDNTELDMVRQILADIDGIPVIVNANGTDTNYESLIIYGFTQDFNIILPGPIKSKGSLEFEGLI